MADSQGDQSDSFVYHSHDKFFKAIMQDIHVARDFLKNSLPENLTEIVNLDTLKATSGSFVSSDLKGHYTDLLYSVQLKNSQSAYVYMLIEHKSSPYFMTLIQLLNYMCEIWLSEYKNTGCQKLSAIIPIVVYHGKNKFPHSLHFFDYFFDEHRQLMQSFFTQQFPIIDLTQIEDEQLREQQWAGLMAFSLKHIFERDFLPIFKKTIDWLDELRDEKYSNLKCALIYYVTNRRTDEEIKAMTEMLTLSPKQNEPFGDENGMSLIEYWLQQGESQGLSQGKEIERMLIARKMLAENADVEFTSKVTGLTKIKLDELLTELSVTEK